MNSIVHLIMYCELPYFFCCPPRINNTSDSLSLSRARAQTSTLAYIVFVCLRVHEKFFVPCPGFGGLMGQNVGNSLNFIRFVLLFSFASLTRMGCWVYRVLACECE